MPEIYFSGFLPPSLPPVRAHIQAMLYFLAIFCSPLALLFAGKPISALFNLILYILSIALWATIILHHAGFLVWLLAFLHAVFAIHDARQARYARRMAESGWSQPPY